MVAELSGSVVGYTVAWYAADEGELANLAVSPAARQKGIGSALVNGVISAGAARGMRRLFLEVRTSNVAARALYLAAGLREVGRRPRYYSGPVEDAIIMMWESAGEHPPRAAPKRPELR